MFQLSNDLLNIKVKAKGAELCEISSVKNNRQFMWHADPKVWASYAPNLFPIIGSMKDDSYVFNEKTYHMPKHGFVRHNEDIKLLEQTENSLTFSLKQNKKISEWFPFDFEFLLKYTLTDNILTLTHTVKNLDDSDMYFSIGGHPAFKCPFYDEENYTDYHLEFEHPETAKSYLLNMDNGLVTDQTKPVFNTKNTINLKPDLFNEDALIFKDLTSRKVALVSKNHGEILNVSFPDFKYLGIWAKPNAPYVCIEPWLGIADHENTNQDITKKEGIIKLAANKTFTASYSIQIHNQHLE
ncbi:aldose 1-epimerase family protein [Mesoflavibacter sp. SCSIO 43206]|uniref:aldose 1-epimerase family protein n=1 Tax=Mesoflavibacter sp. SCSIO 43206 TaxID=2779362 RepID=UPI001CA8D8A8|nr:aldose 1-epimerase family protein [Mesoflavibacter sp. SCSIO 43206]UAB75324.1 aldose 1-epimerase family protein [Mesoflavibacter sp. SCSIO 43206]